MPMSRNPARYLPFFALPLACSFAPVAAVAQSAQVLEEVIVTARKREQSLQDVSVAVTALSAADLAASQIRNSEDLTFLVPSLNYQKGSNPRQSSFNIRGIGTQSFSTGVEPSVSTMVDGVVMGRSLQAFMQLLDVERVEVLRGPQGTLFGKNSTAGVVHIITQNPAEEFEAELVGAVEEGEEYRAGFNISAPLTDQLGFRLAGFYSDEDGWIENVATGDEYNGGEEYSVRGKLRWTPTDTLDFKWTSDYAEMDCDCSQTTIRSMDPFGGNEAQVEAILAELSPVVPGDENDKVNVNYPPENDWESWGHGLEVNWDIGDFTVTSITAYRESSIFANTDDDGRPTNPIGFEQSGGTDQEQWTQELRLTSPAEDRFNYVLGFFYFDQEVSRQFIRQFEFAPGLPGIGISTFSVDTENWALFGEATYSFSDDWRLVAGARYTEDELDFVFERTREGFPVGVPDPVEKTPGGTDEDDTSGKLALEWDFSEDGMAYLSFTQGYKGPAYDVTFGTNPVTLEPVDPETSESWEFGLKSTFFDNRLRFSVAIFHTEYDDFQGQAFFDSDGRPDCPDDNPGCDPEDDPGSFQLVNAGKVESEGVELDFTALLLPNLRLFGGIAYVDATIDEYEGGPCTFGQQFRGECPDGVQDLSGGEMPHSPDWKGSLTAQYTIETDWSFDLQLQGAMRFQDDVLYTLAQDEYTTQDGYEIFDASVSLLDKSDRWDASFYVKNVFDEFYVAGIGSTLDLFIPNGYLQQVPRYAERTAGLELRLRW
jgi:iron complex outermembrane receptor protein